MGLENAQAQVEVGLFLGHLLRGGGEGLKEGLEAGLGVEDGLLEPVF